MSIATKLTECGARPGQPLMERAEEWTLTETGATGGEVKVPAPLRVPKLTEAQGRFRSRRHPQSEISFWPEKIRFR